MYNDLIPIVTCFDNNYVIPAGVCFYSLLKNANQAYNYKIYVLHNDITDENKQKLIDTIKKFQNGAVEFINMNNKFKDLFDKISNKGFYSKEMFYKFCIPSLFPQYEKIVITDVDVCFLGDISKEFLEIDLTDSYIGAFKAFLLKGSLSHNYLKLYEANYTNTEQEAVQYAGGYYIFNLEKMRKDGLEARFIDFAEKNCKRLIQPEQDAINIVCYPYIKNLSPNSLVCTYMYDFYTTEEDFNNDLNYNAQEIKYALQNPIQLHFATHVKPWKDVKCTKNEVFFEYLAKTPFLNDVLKTLVNEDWNKEFRIKLFNKIPIIKICKNKNAYLLNLLKIGTLQVKS